MIPPPVPSLPSLRQAARSTLSVLLGARLQEDGSVDWSDVDDELAVFGSDVARLAGVAVGVIHDDHSIEDEPSSDELDFTLEVMADPPIVLAILTRAEAIAVVHPAPPERQRPGLC